MIDPAFSTSQTHDLRTWKCCWFRCIFLCLIWICFIAYNGLKLYFLNIIWGKTFDLEELTSCAIAPLTAMRWRHILSERVGPGFQVDLETKTPLKLHLETGLGSCDLYTESVMWIYWCPNVNPELSMISFYTEVAAERLTPIRYTTSQGGKLIFAVVHLYNSCWSRLLWSMSLESGAPSDRPGHIETRRLARTDQR